MNWAWDAEAGLFLRSQSGSPHELTDGQAEHEQRRRADRAVRDRPAGGPEAQTVGTGAVVVYSNGLKVEGTWTRENPEDPFTLEAGGAPILLTPGRHLRRARQRRQLDAHRQRRLTPSIWGRSVPNPLPGRIRVSV